MSERAAEFRAAEQRVGRARIRLSDAARALTDAVVRAGALDDRDLVAAAAAVEAVNIALDAATADLPPPTSPRAFPEYVARHRLVGLAHPISPRATWEMVDGRLEVRATFGEAFEGPEGSVHGGILALAFDDLLGLAASLSGRGGVTATLHLRYRRPTPLHQELRFTGWIDRVEGHRQHARGTVHAGDVLTAEAEGLFVTPRSGQLPPVG